MLVKRPILFKENTGIQAMNGINIQVKCLDQTKMILLF